jgi:hypothetical protein
MLNALVGMQDEDGRARVGDVLARPVRAHRADWHVLASFGRARSGQCHALAIE